MTKMQAKVLALAWAPTTALQAAKRLRSYPGPMGRCLVSLVAQGLLRARTLACGQIEYRRTAKGERAAAGQ